MMSMINYPNTRLGLFSRSMKNNVIWQKRFFYGDYDAQNIRITLYMTEDVLNQIKENSTAHEIPFGQITDEEMNAGVSNTYHKAFINFDGTYSGSRGFASQGRVSSQGSFRGHLRSFIRNPNFDACVTAMALIKGQSVPQVLEMEYLTRTFQENPRAIGPNVIKGQSSTVQSNGKMQNKFPYLDWVTKFLDSV